MGPAGPRHGEERMWVWVKMWDGGGGHGPAGRRRGQGCVGVGVEGAFLGGWEEAAFFFFVPLSSLIFFFSLAFDLSRRPWMTFVPFAIEM